ncbi:hypothetical protein P7K49_010183 [Saguinus oedipus]|uniref:Uncharacterized protein n=1 Tax=Saguinus oedipus TaxID=9490 RepID=A0ABQ9VQD4_SAGOE|nr:hypothetical protein P7K49_010183 [Saguinus oedipus]
MEEEEEAIGLLDKVLEDEDVFLLEECELGTPASPGSGSPFLVAVKGPGGPDQRPRGSAADMADPGTARAAEGTAPPGRGAGGLPAQPGSGSSSGLQRLRPLESPGGLPGVGWAGGAAPHPRFSDLVLA